ncbi:Proactivator polypeptide, partial [Trachymyrmex cornetzi]
IISVIIEVPGQPLQPVNIEPGDVCIICKIVLQIMDKTISIDDDTREAIAKAAHRACNCFPQIVATECNYFENKYGDSIINLLSKGVNSKEICTRLGLCKESIL